MQLQEKLNMCVPVSRVQNKVAALSSRYASVYMYLPHTVEDNVVWILAAELNVYYFDYNFQNSSKINEHLLIESAWLPGLENKGSVGDGYDHHLTPCIITACISETSKT